MQIPLSPHVIHTYILIIERAYKIKEERKEGGEEGGGGEVPPHTLPIESTGQLDTHLVPRPSKHTQGLHTPLLAGHKGVPPPPSERSTGSRHTSKSLSHTHTPLNSLGQVGVQLDTPPLPHPSGHIQGLHKHTLLAGHKGVPPPSERSTGSRHTSKSLSHTHTP